jgi:outer membrane protein TolC
MPRLLARVTLAVCSLAVASLARAQSAPAPAAAPLSVEESIARALKKNFDLQIQAFSTDLSRESLNIAKAAFEPTFTASTSRSVNQAASTTSTLDGTTTVGPRNDNTTMNVGVNQFIPQTGATVGLSVNTSRSATNSRFSTLNPAFGTGVTATISQPLLKNAGPAVARATYERSLVGLSIASLNYRSRVLAVIHDTEVAYYNLVSARENLRIRQLSLDLAQKLYDENLAKRATGTMTDLDVLTAEVGVANARRAVLQAEQTVRNQEDNLLNLTGPADFTQRPGPVAFTDYTEGTPSFDLAFKAARDNSPDYLATVAALKQSAIDLASARQNRLPTLNLNGSLGYNNTDNSYSNAVNNLVDHHGNNWSLGLSYNMPWGQHADQARYRSAQLTLRQQQARLDQFEQNLIVQVRTAVRAVETNLAAVQIAAKATELSAKQYDLQKARFDAGLSTSRLVLQAQDDLETARVNELAARVTLRTSIADLHRLEGSSLQRYKVELPGN